MPAGTITLTNKSAVIAGAGTTFTTELTAGDFLIAVVGGIPYNFPIKTVDSNTKLTAISSYLGPTASDLAWMIAPRSTQNLITAAIVVQNTEALRGFNYDKQNWQQVLTVDGDVTVTLPDNTQFSGPSWIKIARLAADSDLSEIKPLADQVRADAQQVTSDKNEAKTSAAAAKVSETNAATSETNAGDSKTAAAQSASESAASAASTAGIVTAATAQADRAKTEADRAQAANPDVQLKKAQNLADVADVVQSRKNLQVDSGWGNKIPTKLTLATDDLNLITTSGLVLAANIVKNTPRISSHAYGGDIVTATDIKWVIETVIDDDSGFQRATSYAGTAGSAEFGTMSGRVLVRSKTLGVWRTEWDEMARNDRLASFGAVEVASVFPYIDYSITGSTNPSNWINTDYTMRLGVGVGGTSLKYVSVTLQGAPLTTGGNAQVNFYVRGGYTCSSGLAGNGSDNAFNFTWGQPSDGMHAWIDTTRVGQLAWNPASDVLLKEEIVYEDEAGQDALGEVLQWRAAKFRYKARGIIPQSNTQLGFIANDLIVASPECVTGKGLKEGYDPLDTSEAYGLDTIAMIAKLTQAVQALTNKAEKLEARIAELENR